MSDPEKINKIYSELAIQQVRDSIWYERIIYSPIKVLIAYAVYEYLEYGVFFIFAYVLFCLGEQSAKQYVNSHELNATIKNTHESLAGHLASQQMELAKQVSRLSSRIEALETQLESDSDEWEDE